jgi:hypothetical protein
VKVDRRHKLVRRYKVTDAAVHDSRVVEDILDPNNTASEYVGGQCLSVGGDRCKTERLRA